MHRLQDRRVRNLRRLQLRDPPPGLPGVWRMNVSNNPSPGWLVTPSSELPSLPGISPAMSEDELRRLVAVHAIPTPEAEHRAAVRLLRLVEEHAERSATTRFLLGTAGASALALLTFVAVLRGAYNMWKDRRG